MKLGIIPEGGASRSLFSCGVTDVLLEEGIMPDYFVGVSAGIAFGVSYISKQTGRNMEMAEQYMHDKRYMGLHHWIRTRNYYNVDFVFDEIPNQLLPLDYEAFEAYPGVIEAGVTNVRTGKIEYVPVPRDKTMKDVLVASCSLPLLFKPVRLGDDDYMDGGIINSIPYSRAIEMGCDKILVILTRPRDYQKPVEKAANFSTLFFREHKEFVQAVRTRSQHYNENTKRLAQLEAEGKAFVISPDDTFGVSRTESDPEKLRKLYEAGRDKMNEKLEEFKAYLNR